MNKKWFFDYTVESSQLLINIAFGYYNPDHEKNDFSSHAEEDIYVYDAFIIFGYDNINRDVVINKKDFTWSIGRNSLYDTEQEARNKFNQTKKKMIKDVFKYLPEWST